jgi:hypothetical protein
MQSIAFRVNGQIGSFYLLFYRTLSPVAVVQALPPGADSRNALAAASAVLVVMADGL